MLITLDQLKFHDSIFDIINKLQRVIIPLISVKLSTSEVHSDVAQFIIFAAHRSFDRLTQTTAPVIDPNSLRPTTKKAS